MIWNGEEDQSSEIEQKSDDLSSLLARNRAWASSKTRDDPNFFSRLVGQQHPRYFWIGCSDSRVPATEIVDLDPGEMFVHRNIANLAVADDPNFAAALLFAVDVLQVFVWASRLARSTWVLWSVTQRKDLILLIAPAASLPRYVG